MIEFRQGDMFASGAQVLVNPVNCVGVSGTGIALEFKKRFTANQRIYEYHCRHQQLQPGELLLCREKTPDQLIFNVTTKNHWENPSDYLWVSKCCKNIRFYCELLQINTIALPALGCGKGGLDWYAVKDLMQVCFHGSYEMTNYYIYEPYDNNITT